MLSLIDLLGPWIFINECAWVSMLQSFGCCCCISAVNESRQRLLSAGFKELNEADHWSIQPLDKVLSSFQSYVGILLVDASAKLELLRGRHWGTLTYSSALITGHQHLSSARRSSFNSDWPVHSLILLFNDLCNLPLCCLSRRRTATHLLQLFM